MTEVAGVQVPAGKYSSVVCEVSALGGWDRENVYRSPCISWTMKSHLHHWDTFCLCLGQRSILVALKFLFLSFKCFQHVLLSLSGSTQPWLWCFREESVAVMAVLTHVFTPVVVQLPCFPWRCSLGITPLYLVLTHTRYNWKSPLLPRIIHNRAIRLNQ